ncbi:hypothetical protein HDU98_002489 [Podochytrium sp. JEL0797]|nr:hypothetical protein HDU98_002489 [Podochytrium sp. JEL0797]
MHTVSFRPSSSEHLAWHSATFVAPGDLGVSDQSDVLKGLKAQKTPTDALVPHVDRPVSLKAELAARVAKNNTKKFDRSALEGDAAQVLLLCPKTEIEITNLTPEAVLKTSGHVDRFVDYMVKDLKTALLNARLDTDEALANGTFDKKVPKGKPMPESLAADVKHEYDMVLEAPKLFNLMFETQIGRTGRFKGYLHPETAQDHFLNFKRYGEQPGPDAGLLRVREFTMAEIEHCVDPLKKDHPRFDKIKDLELTLYPADRQLVGSGAVRMTMGDVVAQGVVNNQTLGCFVCRIYLFLICISIKPTRLRFRQHQEYLCGTDSRDMPAEAKDGGAALGGD